MFLRSLWKRSCVFSIERWLGRGDWPEVLCEGVWVWCGEELWLSDTGETVYATDFRLYIHPFLSFSVNHTRSQFLLHFLIIPLSWLTSLSVSLPPFSQYLSLSVFLYHFHLIPVRSHLTVSLTRFLFCPPDARGRVHTVCHDSWDQAELDRSFKEVYPAQQLSRPHTVRASWIQLTYKNFKTTGNQGLKMFTITIIFFNIESLSLVDLLHPVLCNHRGMIVSKCETVCSCSLVSGAPAQSCTEIFYTKSSSHTHPAEVCWHFETLAWVLCEGHLSLFLTFENDSISKNDQFIHCNDFLP